MRVWISTQLGSRHRSMFALFLLLSCVGAVLLLSVTAINSLWDGALEMTPDSVQYVAAAQNILSGHDFMRYEGWAYVAWPPLYATIIAVLYSFTRHITTDLIHALRYFHVFLYMTIIFCSGLLFIRYVRSRLIALFGVIAALTGPVLYVSHLVWSEELFSLLIILFLLAAGKLMDSPSPRWIVITAVLAGLAVLQRYSGVTVIMTGGLLILFLLYRWSFWQRIRYAILYGVIAVTPILLWMVRNYLLTGLPAGTRSPSERPLIENLGTTVHFLRDWFVTQDPSALTAPLVVLLLAGLGLAFFQQYYLRHERHVLARLEQVIPLPVILFVTVYIAFLNATLSIFNQGAISLQYLMPVHIPLLIVICALADNVARLSWGRYWVQVIVAVWITFYVVPASIAEVTRLTSLCCPIAWRNSELIDWLETHEIPQPLYANTPLSQYRGIRVIDLPRQLELLSQTLPYYAPPDKDGIYVIWYNYLQHDTCPRCYYQKYTFEDYRNMFTLTPIVELDDGAIYHVTPLQVTASVESGF